MEKQTKAYRADMKCQYKRKHRKGIGVTSRMKQAEIFRDLYARRTDHRTGKPLDRFWHPGKKWLRRRLELVKSLRENEFLIIELA